MNEFVRLAEHVDLLTGFPFKSAEFTADSSDVLLLRGDNVAQRRIRWDGAQRWPAAKSADFAAYRVRRGDVIVAMDRPWIAAGLKVAEVRNDSEGALLVQRVARLRAKDTVDQGFLKWLLYSDEFTKYLRGVETGTAIPHISARQILDYKFALPALDEQRRIASALGRLDDLVETNRQLAADLRDVGAQIYRKAIAVSPVEVAIEQCAVFHNRTRVPLSKAEREAMPGEYPYYGATGVVGTVGGYLFDGVRILVGEDGSVVEADGTPVVQMVWGKYWVNNHAHVLTGLGISDGLLRHALRTTDVRPAVTGAVQPKLSMARLKSLAVRLPKDGNISARLNELAEAERNIHDEINDLIRLRDDLLPLLMSGKVRVRDLNGAT